MFIRKTTRRYKDRTYTHYLVVETVSTPKGPRQRTICSLGDLAPGPKSKWPGLMKQVEDALSGQVSLETEDPLVPEVAARVREAMLAVESARAVVLPAPVSQQAVVSRGRRARHKR